MKLTRDELLDIFATISAEEVQKFCEMTQATALEELAIVVLMAKVLDRVEDKIFK